jgi:hypothetical protein
MLMQDILAEEVSVRVSSYLKLLEGANPATAATRTFILFTKKKARFFLRRTGP